MLHGISSTRRQDHTGALTITTTNGYTLQLSANAYDVASWVNSNAADDVAALVAKLVKAPVRDDATKRAIAEDFEAECLAGVEGEDMTRAWTEYAHEIADAAINQIPTTTEEH